MKERNKVLFIGNGLDLLCGYKTDYVSFLESYSNYYTVMVHNYIDNKILRHLGNKIAKINGDSSLSSVTILMNQNKDNLKKKIKTHKDLTSCNIKEFDLQLLNIHTEFKKLKDNKFYDAELEVDDQLIINPWICYFIYSYVNGINHSNNWIDLEELIYINASNIDENAKKDEFYYYEDYKKKFHPENNDINIEEFNDMKKTLAEYLIKEKQNKYNIIRTMNSYNYDLIINFNYTKNYLLPNDDLNIKQINIHGDVNDKENIVFGFDDGILTNHDTQEYSYNDKDMKLSKTYQLFSLLEQKDNKFCIPINDKIEKIGFLGHGIGEQDYNYIRTLCGDFEHIQFVIYWYKYKDKEGNERDNKISQMDNFVKMIHNMEKQLKKKILHKLLLEGNVKFEEFIIEPIEKEV